VNGHVDPPIAKLEDYGHMMVKKYVKAKEIRLNQKARSLKEMFVGGGIDQHDLGIKMSKVIAFLEDGHPVRVFVTAKKNRLKVDPFCVEETTLKVLELVEDYVQSVQQPENATSMRKDFTLNPKPVAATEVAAKAKEEKRIKLEKLLKKFEDKENAKLERYGKSSKGKANKAAKDAEVAGAAGGGAGGVAMTAGLNGDIAGVGVVGGVEGGEEEEVDDDDDDDDEEEGVDSKTDDEEDNEDDDNDDDDDDDKIKNNKHIKKGRKSRGKSMDIDGTDESDDNKEEEDSADDRKDDSLKSTDDETVDNDINNSDDVSKEKNKLKRKNR
jgi:translation initiation factor IF-3